MAVKFKFSGGEIINEPHHTDCINLIDKENSLVFVGWRGDTTVHPTIDYAQEGKQIVLIEIWQPRCNDYTNAISNLSGNNNVKVVCDDIKNVYRNYSGCLIWQDGPEHLTMEESVNLLQDMKNYYNSIIISTPCGPFPQGQIDGNPAEEHKSTWYEQDYINLGFTYCHPDNNPTFILGYWSK